MKSGRIPLLPLLLALVLAAGLCAGAAWADEYSEVAQLLRDGKLAEAQTRVDRALAAKPRDPQMRLYRGVIQRDSGRPGEAMATFAKLSEEHPELPEPYNNLAVLYAAQGQYDKARVALEKALRTHPSYATAHDNLAEVYARLASQAYSKALQIDSAAASSAPTQLALIRELPAPAGSPPRAQLAAVPTTPPPVLAKPAAPVVTAASPPAKPAVVAAAPVQPKPAAAPAVVPAAPASAAAPAGATNGQREVEQAVRAWARAWSDKNMSQYLAAYDKGFDTPGQQSRSAWEQDRRLRITSKSRISVNLLELQITVNGNRAVAKFRQDYKADALAVLSRKTLELSKTGDRWLIVKESSGG